MESALESSSLVLARGSIATMSSIKDLLKSLKLPVDGVAEHIDNFLVISVENRLIATGGLEIYGRYALLRSVAVSPESQKKGIGKLILNALKQKAREADVEVLYLLTETAATYFSYFGFKKIPRSSVAPHVQKSVEFLYACPASAICMELVLERPDNRLNE